MNLTVDGDSGAAVKFCGGSGAALINCSTYQKYYNLIWLATAILIHFNVTYHHQLTFYKRGDF